MDSIVLLIRPEVAGVFVRDDVAVQWIVHASAAQRTALVVEVLVVAFLAGQSWWLLRLGRQQDLILQRLAARRPSPAPTSVRQAGLSPGSPAPDFRLEDLDGNTVTLLSLLSSGKPLLLVFIDLVCPACGELMPYLGRWEQDFGRDVEIAVLSNGTAEQNQQALSHHGISRLLLQPDRSVELAYQINGNPSAVFVRPDGTIGSPAAAGAENIRWLFDRILGMVRPASQSLPSDIEPLPVSGLGPNPIHVPGIGDPAPWLRLLDRNGEVVELAELRGAMTLLLVWRSSCGFCRSILEEIRAWEDSPPPGAAKLIVASVGDFDVAGSLPFRSTVVVDPAARVAAAFGIDGTPMGVLLNEHGIVVARAGGASHVLDLLGAQPSKSLATSA